MTQKATSVAKKATMGKVNDRGQFADDEDPRDSDDTGERCEKCGTRASQQHPLMECEECGRLVCRLCPCDCGVFKPLPGD